MTNNIKNSVVKTVKIIDSINEFLGEKIAWLNILTLLFSFSVTALRYIFNYGNIALQESAMYFHIMVFVFASAWVLKQDEHVRVDVLYRSFSFKAKALLNALGTLLFLIPVSVFIIWVSLDYVAMAWSIKEGSPDVGGLDYYYILKTCIPAMFVLLLLQGIAEFLRNCLYLFADMDYREI